MDYEAIIAHLLLGESITPEQFGELTDEQVGEFETALIAAFDERTSPDLVPVPSRAQLTEAAALSQAIDQVRSHADERLTEAETLVSEAAEMAARIHVVPAEEEVAPVAEVVEEVPAVEVETPAPVAEVVPEVAPEPVPVAAAARPVRTALEQLARAVPANQRPQARHEGRITVRASSNLSMVAAGAPFEDERHVALAMIEALRSVEGDASGISQDVRVGQVTWSDRYGPDRHLTASASGEQNAAIIQAALRARHDNDSLTAAVGGLCAPVPIRYELMTFTNTQRPVRDGLASFNADRGGIQFNNPPTLASITTSTAQVASSAIGVVTVAQDASTATKSVQDVDCGTLVTEKVQAIYNRLQFSNFGDRYNPERMQAYMGLADTALARVAERQLVTAMKAGGTLASNSALVKLVNGGAVFSGATRQWASNIISAVTNFRYRHRMRPTQTFRAVAPEWLGAVVGVDLLLQQPGDNTIDESGLDGLNWCTALLRSYNIEPIWTQDDALANDANGAGGPAYTTQSAGTLVDFPGEVSTLLFPEGTYLLLDGGELNFGIVRDSTLNAANRFQTFSEIFEGVAMVGPEAYNLTTFICADGASSAAITNAKCGGVGS